MEEADGDRLDALLAQPGGELAALGVVERTHDRAVGRNALVQLEAEVPLDERRRLAPEEVVHVRDPEPAQLEHVAEAGGGDEGGQAAAPLEHGVRRDRRPVDDFGDRSCVRGGESADRLHDRAVVAGRRREQLAQNDAAVGAVEDHVGEGAADVDADPGLRRSHDEICDFMLRRGRA